MLLRSLYAAAVAALLLPSAAFAADTFTLDPAHTQTIFTIDHLDYSMITGNFHELMVGRQIAVEVHLRATPGRTP